MKPRDEMIAMWRRILGEVPDPELLGQLDSLNRIPEAVIAAAHRLGRPRQAAGLITSYLRPDRQMFVDLFVQEVVFGDVAAADWRRGRTLVPAWSFVEHVTLLPEQLLAPLGGMSLQRVAPSLRDWSAGTSWVGAPCLAQPALDYLTPDPEHAAGLVSPEVEDIADPVIAVRRWIAARIAAVVRSKVGTNFAGAAEAAAAFIPLSSWTPDAHAALAGLIRESNELGASLDAAPGFRGPDAWFRG